MDDQPGKLPFPSFFYRERVEETDDSGAFSGTILPRRGESSCALGNYKFSYFMVDNHHG